MKRIIVAGAIALGISGCSTIQFEQNANAVVQPTTQQQWHHTGGIFGLVEFSPAYNPKAECGAAGWESVTVEHEFLQAMIGIVVPLGIYRPWEVGATCKR